MKRNFFKGMLVPVATVLLGTAGAFVTTSAGTSKTLVDAQGHYYLNAQRPCVESIMCQTVDNGQICTSGAFVLKGLDEGCTQPLWKKP